jgi:uncharacterized tellurite resistance protein B-like protein
MAPEVADNLAQCREHLGYAAPIEVYVRPHPMLNASVMRSASGTGIMILSSRLLEVMSPAELRFVMGHEMGHLALRHNDIPMPATAIVEDMGGTIAPRATALKLFHWARAAEISADRCGLVCGGDPEAAASGFFKIASGLSSSRVRTDLEAYAKQVDSLCSAPSARKKIEEDDKDLDCFSTHPYSPVRVRAILAFSRSQCYRQALGLGSDGLSDAEVDALVDAELLHMEPSYLEEKSPTAEAMRRLLFLGGLSVAAAHEDVSDIERQALAALLGSEAVKQQSRLTIEEVRRELDEKLDASKAAATLRQRGQFVQHLTVIAAADGDVAKEELAEMERLAARLDVDPLIIHQTLRAATQPLD